MTTSDTLAVWLGGERVATLRHTRDRRLELTYEPDVRARLGIGALCLSAALPVQPDPYTGDQVLWWVEGLLPEGEARTLLEEHFEVRRGDAFGLLRAIGRECAGAVAFMPTDENPTRGGDTNRLDDADLEAAIAALPQHPLGADFDVPVSLAGLQSKLLLRRTTDGWARPGRGAPSTHILKPDPFEHQGLIAAEAFSLALARAAGLDAATAELTRIADRGVLIVERFDRRVRQGGGVDRIHQEDGCQALGIDPSGRGKYQRPSRKLPSYEGLAGVLRHHARDPYAEWTRLAQAMALAIGIGNTDAHARNCSFVFTSGTLQLAPIYDVAPTVEFVRSEHAALWISGQGVLEKVTFHHLALEARAWGLSRVDADTTIGATIEALLDAVPAAADHVPVVPGQIVDDISRRLRRILNSRRSQT
ncbi:MAG: type II toxin-antitoxin system HipA family toxin [Acidimicrobiales bacterium]